MGTDRIESSGGREVKKLLYMTNLLNAVVKYDKSQVLMNS